MHHKQLQQHTPHSNKTATAQNIIKIQIRICQTLDKHGRKKAPGGTGAKVGLHQPGGEKQAKHLPGDPGGIYTAPTSGASLAIMLDHLLNFEPPAAALDDVRPLEQVSPAEVVAAQLSTAQWLEQLGAANTEAPTTAQERILAQDAFKNLAGNADSPKQRQAVLALKTPPAVRHLTGMLTAYDWAFVEQANELRGYAVAQILEETKHPDARIRLRALELLGRVTEVALFTDRMEIKKTEMPDHELDAKIKEKLNRFMGVVDTEVVDLAPKLANNEENT